MRDLLADFICLAGLGSTLFGLYMIYPPLTYVVGGLIVSAAAVNIARKAK